MYIDDIEDDNIEYLEPIESLDKIIIRDFFQKELDQIRGLVWDLQFKQLLS